MSHQFKNVTIGFYLDNFVLQGFPYNSESILEEASLRARAGLPVRAVALAAEHPVSVGVDSGLVNGQPSYEVRRLQEVGEEDPDGGEQGVGAERRENLWSKNQMEYRPQVMFSSSWLPWFPQPRRRRNP